jgi:hypothetical protein
VPRDERQGGIRQFAVNDVEVGAADAAGQHLKQDLTGGDHRPGAVDRFERATGLPEKHRSHRQGQ